MTIAIGALRWALTFVIASVEQISTATLAAECVGGTTAGLNTLPNDSPAAASISARPTPARTGANQSQDADKRT